MKKGLDKKALDKEAAFWGSRKKVLDSPRKACHK